MMSGSFWGWCDEQVLLGRELILLRTWQYSASFLGHNIDRFSLPATLKAPRTIYARYISSRDVQYRHTPRLMSRRCDWPNRGQAACFGDSPCRGRRDGHQGPGACTKHKARPKLLPLLAASRPPLRRHHHCTSCRFLLFCLKSLEDYIFYF